MECNLSGLNKDQSEDLLGATRSNTSELSPLSKPDDNMGPKLILVILGFYLLFFIGTTGFPYHEDQLQPTEAAKVPDETDHFDADNGGNNDDNNEEYNDGSTNPETGTQENQENHQTTAKRSAAYLQQKTTKNPNNIPPAQRQTADVFSLYDKWHGFVMVPEGPPTKTDVPAAQKVICEISIEQIHVTDSSILSGNGKFYGKDFTFQGTVKPDGSLNLNFSQPVSWRLSSCTFNSVNGFISFDSDKEIWIYKGNITESDDTFILEPVNQDPTTQALMRTPKYDKTEIANDKNSAFVALGVCGGLLFLLLTGFVIAKLMAR